MHLIIGIVCYYYHYIEPRSRAHHVPVINTRAEAIVFFTQDRPLELGNLRKETDILSMMNEIGVYSIKTGTYFPPILTFRGNQVQQIHRIKANAKTRQRKKLTEKKRCFYQIALRQPLKKNKSDQELKIILKKGTICIYLYLYAKKNVLNI